MYFSMRVLPAATFLFVLNLSLCAVKAQDWPQWRGPNRDGKTTARFAVPANWPASLTKKWDITIGSGVANPSLVGNRLYVIGREGENEVVRCLDAATSDEIWKASYASTEPTGFGAGNGRFVGPRSTPTVANGYVNTLSANGLLSTFDAGTGQLKWRKDEFVGKVPTFYTSSSPLVTDGMCIAQLGAGNADAARPGETGFGALIAYNLATGEEKWRANEGSPSYASPIEMTVDGLAVVIALSETQLVAVNRANGRVVWKLPLRQGRYNSSSPFVDGQTLIIGGPGTRGLTALTLTRQGDQLKEEEAWSYNENQLIFNTPVLRDGALFAYNTRDEIFSVKPDHTTGWAVSIVPPSAGTSRYIPAVSQTVFAQPQPQQPGRGRGDAGRGGQQRGRGARSAGGGERPGYGSVVDAGSAMFALCPGGDLVVFAPNAETYTEFARYKVSTDGDVYSHPIVSGNRIYIKDRDSVALFTVE
jgi:outer membrane protein assembly factor BamB